MTETYDQRETLHAARADTRRPDTHGPSVAMCTMDASGKIRFAGDAIHIHALQAAIAERYFSVEEADTHDGPWCRYTCGGQG
jgi:hypothetical protein